MIVTIFKNIITSSVGYDRPVDVIFDRIRKGASKGIIEVLRSESDPKKFKNIKEKIPCILFSGIFKNKKHFGIAQHSGLICLDFDKFETQEALVLNREKFIKDPLTFSVFTSPSGKGLKVIVRISPPEAQDINKIIIQHKSAFKSLEKYYDSKYFDSNCSNINRGCFESFDPDIFVNNDSKIFEYEITEDEDISTDVPVVALTSSNRIIDNLLKWFNSNFSMASGNRNSNLFKLASALNDYGISKMDAESVCLNFSSKDFTDREISQIVKSAYSKTSNFGTKFFEDGFKKKKIENAIRSGKPITEIKKEFKEPGVSDFIESVKNSMANFDFWDYSEKGKVVLSPHKYKSFLQENKFFKFIPNGSNNFIFIKIERNLIEDTTSNKIKDFVLNYLEKTENIGMQPFDYMANSTKYFKDDYLNFLDTISVNIKEDTQEKCYLYYENCAVEVSKNEIKKIDYLDLDGFVWKNQVIGRNFEDKDPTGCIFEKFISKISGGEKQKFVSFCSLIGYLLHSFKTPANNKAVILNDETISENPNGGSGKGIFCNAIGKMKKMVSIDGKQFGFDKSFAYQLVQADTQVLLFDDVKKNFAFENLFSLITEGITIEKKNKDAIKIDVHKSPKIVITTNYPIGGIGGSFDRRKLEFEFSSYFSSKHTPFDEFGSMLFDWDNEEWQKFDNFMIQCVQVYILKGIIVSESKNLDLKKFIKETSTEFSDWCRDGAIEKNIKIYKSKKYTEFIEEFADFKNLTRKRFSQWTECYTRYIGAEYISGKDQEGRYFVIK
jgi:hypothetical protein